MSETATQLEALPQMALLPTGAPLDQSLASEEDTSLIDKLIVKTKCKSCLEIRNEYLNKVNWDKYTNSEIHQQLTDKLCPQHLLKNIVFLSENVDNVKAKLRFHETKAPINYNDCCVKYLPSLIGQKAIHNQKSKDFINGVVEYVLTAKDKLYKNIKPNVLKKYMKNAPLTIEFYSQFKLDDKYFPLCIENGYPYSESLDACFNKKRAKDLLSYIELIKLREEKERLSREITENTEIQERVVVVEQPIPLIYSGANVSNSFFR